jgi:transcription elongation factor S-II
MEINSSTRKNNASSINKFVNDKTLSSTIEESIHNFTTDYVENNDAQFLFESVYNTKFDEIISNIDTKGHNKNLLPLILNKTVKGENVAFLTPDELDPEKYETIIKKKQIEEYKKQHKATTDAFKCSKCKQKKCTVEEKQTRAGDEPMTTFVTCQNCGYTFKF